jgi:hypothetical protein
MSGSYDTHRTGVLRTAGSRRAWSTALAATLAVSVGVAAHLVPGPGDGLAAQAPAPPPPPPPPPEVDGPILLQLRVYNGTDEVTPGSRLHLYPVGQRTSPIPLNLGPDRVYEARVAPGFYDVQAVQEDQGRVSAIRWFEQMLVQRYPDEYGRHLQVVNFRTDFGALQIRPQPGTGGAARGWSATLHPAGDETRELGKARQFGEDLIVIAAAGRYDVRVTLADRSTHWLRDVEIPADGTRLKTWTPER